MCNIFDLMPSNWAKSMEARILTEDSLKNSTRFDRSVKTVALATDATFGPEDGTVDASATSASPKFESAADEDAPKSSRVRGDWVRLAASFARRFCSSSAILRYIARISRSLRCTVSWPVEEVVP